jgi:hypothetical protein
MSKGWESKNVEEQMAAMQEPRRPEERIDPKVALTKADISRQRQSLELQREQILNQRTSNAHRRTALAAALEHVEQQLRALEPDTN